MGKLKYAFHGRKRSVLGGYSCTTGLGTNCHLVGASINILAGER